MVNISNRPGCNHGSIIIDQFVPNSGFDSRNNDDSNSSDKGCPRPSLAA